ncbi:V-type ATPase subunit [candidate division WOR-3 bacterium]|nr:V-type ATPase subunit [candidate division WOR-3 bacterium]
MIQGTDDTRYAFVNGIIRAREARFLTKGHFDRLIAGDLTSFKSILADSPYSVHGDIEEGMNIEEQRTKDFLHQHCMTPEIVQFVEWPEQIHNIKVKIKQGIDSMLYNTVGNDVEAWPEVQEVIENYALSKDPFLVSIELDRVLCSHLHSLVGFFPFFAGFFDLHMDLENIRSFFRARQFDNSRDVFKQVYLPFGTLQYETFITNINTEIDHLCKVLFVTPYQHLIDRGGVYLEQHHSFLRMERLIEEMKLNYLSKARYMAFGVEPLFGFYQFKKSEIRKLQQVYWGKLNEVAVEDLKESIPDVW